MIITRTPFRISFAGGGSDLEAYYRHRVGVVLSTAINHYMYISVMDRFGDTYRISYSRTELVDRADQIQHPIVRECIDLLKVRGGLEIVSMANLPAESGMGSSSSFTVGLLNALHAMNGHVVTAHRLASEACEIEIDRLGEPIGKQDQFIAAYGGLQFIQFHPDGHVSIDPVICASETRRELNRRLMVFYLGGTRAARDILTRQSANAAHHLKTVGQMCDIAQQLREVLTSGRDLNEFGRLLHCSWELKKSLEGTISNEWIDQQYERGLRAGALGGKLLGAGGGGFLLFYCEPHLQNRLRAELQEFSELPLAFDLEGSKVIHVGSDRW
jgi:D-glycero-alpha-D-manno-heptose-7-phosphate kinase